ncbi:MAG: hypothetical protein GY854_19685 [Deltaproteobacteria bacterium]|nr:hypothetical protein [Deltaproteobacteria bacterium]
MDATCKHITIDQLLQWGTFGYDTSAEIIAKTDNDWPKTPLQICALDIPVDVRLEILVRVIPSRQLHVLACDSAETALPIYEHRYPDDTRPRDAITAKRAWVADETTDRELAVARTAAWAAFSSTTWDDACDAALAAARATDTHESMWQDRDVVAEAALAAINYAAAAAARAPAPNPSDESENAAMSRVVEVLEELHNA